MRLRSFVPALAVVTTFAALACALPCAWAGVDVGLGNGDKVTGTLLPASEIETFRINVPEGAVFKLKVKGRPAQKKGPKPPATLRLLDPDGVEVGAELVKRKKTSATLKGYRAERTGEYRIEVSGDDQTSGNYLLVVKWVSPKKLAFDLDDAGPGTPSNVALPLDAGAKLKLKLKASKGSVATPAAEQLIGPDTFQSPLEPPPAGASSHSLKNLIVPEFGDTTLVASGGGAYRATVTITPPKPSKRKISLTGAEIGGKPFTGGDTAVGKVITPGGGGTVSIDGVQSPLVGGASVFVPTEAITTPTAIFIGESSPLPNQNDGEQAAGPSVFFGPEGLTFQTPVLVTIPWDAELFTDDADNLRVYTRDEDDNVTEITDFTVDSVAGTVTFAVSHFSSFRVFGPRLPAPTDGDLDVDGVGDLVLRAPHNGAGLVYVFPSRRGGVPQQGADTTSASIVLAGDNGGDRFGASVGVGDLNQDGREDLVVSANRANVAGEVYVFFGGSTFDPATPTAIVSASEADAIIRPQQGDFSFGIRFDVGDVNGDLIDDLVIGSEGSSISQGGAGAVYIVYGAPEFGTRSSGSADVTLLGKRQNDAFGASVAVGDVTGDGVSDVIVGADERQVPDTGAVYVFVGGADLASLKSNKADFSLAGAAVGDRFGLEIAVGDVDGDLVADVLIASPGDDEGGNLSGAVFVHFGGNLNGQPAKLTGASPGDDFGFNLTTADLQGDGPLEVIATSGSRSGSRGTLHVFTGTPGFPSQGALSATSVIPGEQTDDVLRVLQPAWDVTGDGLPDIVAYAPGFNSDAGRAYVFVGGPTLPPSNTADQSATFIIDGQPGEGLGGDPIP